MALCEGQYHAQVPVTNVTVTISYCHQCQAFSIYAGRSVQFSDDDFRTYDFVEDHLGPFDGVHTALNLTFGHLEALLLGSGLPWDRSSWDPPPSGVS